MTELHGLAKLPEDIRKRIAKSSRDKGSNYERDVAKKIATYFGWTWEQCFYRTKPHGHAQPNGDIQVINDMADLWRSARLGPIECKNRKEWSFNNLFKNPESNYLIDYWRKSNADTRRDNTVLVFTKPALTDYVMSLDDETHQYPIIKFIVSEGTLVIQTLQSFLKSHWPKSN